ncbi:MAG: ATP-binding protein [Lachnospiraceae bacterium]|nr:ATP-binding protein [Lachnospiraceae bacterium]
MLLQFNVTNFMSIKQEVILTAFANANKDHEDNLIQGKNDRVLPVLALYGANAAGKTNINKALTRAIMLVRKSNELQVNSKTGFEPFLLDDEGQKEKTKMDFLFIHNGKKFAYGFAADGFSIHDEYLYEYKSSRPTMIFERSEINNYRFTSAYKHLSEYQHKNTPNKLFMCTATAWNCEETRDAFLWFAEGIDTYDQLSIRNDHYLEFLDRNKDNPKTKEFLLSLFKHAEINIQDYEFESRVVDNPSVPLPPGITIDPSVFGKMKEYKMSMIHQIEQKDGSFKPYKMPFDHESAGTMLLVAYGPIIMEALARGRTIVVDELDNSLHSSLSRYLIELFNDKTINRNGAQLIFNSHDVNLLDLDLFRRDQIYFVEKNYNTGVTDLYSLADFSPRKTENIQKGYLQGRYGAIPFPEGGIEW